VNGPGGPAALLVLCASLAAAWAAARAAHRCPRSPSGPLRRFWALTACAAVVWGLGTTASLTAAPDVPAAAPGDGATPSLLALAAVATLAVWSALGITAVAALTLRYQTRATLVRDALDLLLLILAAATLLWSVVLEPVVTSRPATAQTWLVAALALVAIDVPLMGVHAFARSPHRDAGTRTALVGLAVVFGGDVVSAHHHLDQGQGGGPVAAVLWGLGWSLVLVAALLGRRRAEDPVVRDGLRGGALTALAAAGLTVLATGSDLVGGGGAAGAVTFWLGTSVLLLVVCRTLLELRRTARLQRHLEQQVEERARALAESRHRFAALVAASDDLVLVVDAEERVTYANPGAARLLGVLDGSATGRRVAEHLFDGQDAASGTDVLRSVVAGRVQQLEVRLALRHADGHRIDVEAVVTDLLDDPDVQGLVINGRDVTEALRLEAELSEQAFSDALTGLPDRALFRDRLEQALRSRAARGPVKVLYLDLDGFKAVNDTLGHDAGDELLVAVARRLGDVVRQGDTLARLGGDEFAVLLDEGVVLDEATVLAGRLCDAVRRPFTVRGVEVHVGASVGLASSRTAGRRAEDVMVAADLAMYQAKAAGKDRFEVYAPRMHEQLAERVQLEADLRRAVQESQFRVVYQPLVDMGTGTTTGVEALVRWHHPTRGVVVPVDFIPLAETTGLIDAIGAFVLREACRQVAAWRAEVPGAEQMRLSVNLSAHQLRDPGLLASIVEALATTGLPAASLVLEITESAFVGQDDGVLAVLESLRELGVRLAIDDFGTGYSSLSYLHRLPVDIIKIDKSFVDRLSENGGASLVDAILSMASALGMTTVAEGVEHEHQRAALAEQGCDTGQGYHFSPPVDAGVLPELVVRALLARAGSDAPAAAPSPGPSPAPSPASTRP